MNRKADRAVEKGLYAGVSAPLVGVTPMCEKSSSKFWACRMKTDHIVS